MDADVQQLSSEEEEIDSTTQDKGNGKNQKTSSGKPRVILTGKKRQRRLSSGVWVNFDFLDEPDENGNLICKCKKCGIHFNADSKNGTGNLHRHLKNCKQRSFRDVGQMILEKTSSGLGNRLREFDANYFRELLSLAIVERDMPFQFVEFKAHYVDKSWCLQKKILNFSYIGPPHTGIHLCDHVYGLLKEWGIQKNIFSITLDNASSNDVFAENLKGELKLICGGEFFHVRCCAHILNLIVQDGLKEIDEAVYKIRESAKYCKSSQARKQRFLSCVSHVEIQSTRILQQDIPTRWNSTYMMLDCALHFKKALIHFQKVDANYVHCPSVEEWGRVEKICKFLKVFHDVTLAFSGTKYPTSNIYFHRVLQVRLLLQNEMKSSDLFMQKMACKMYEKFGKYWSEFSTFMAVAVVLDPRYKLQCVN
ncbi:zinc finger BED domain-containing protein RICESLEEPER 2-like [Chenopodium quinoa]|uniref:zinc finger BED domain-containing protein RICESLEEPER 2-like n=1 Tax=Chenopodium quinoa TaxID=63459 RepID=UPI000B786655|nr:zinc finger BED domain-containing protein RICESLEEPER 2-like [Chenopodium quinoa]